MFKEKNITDHFGSKVKISILKSRFWTLNSGKDEMCWAKTHKGPAGLLLSGDRAAPCCVQEMHHQLKPECGFCSSFTSLVAEPPVVSAVMANINEPSEQQICDRKRAAYAANHKWSWPVHWSVLNVFLRIRRRAWTAYKYIWGSSQGRKLFLLYLKTLQTLTLDEWVGALWSDGHELFHSPSSEGLPQLILCCHTIPAHSLHRWMFSVVFLFSFCLSAPSSTSPAHYSHYPYQVSGLI